MEDFKEYCKHFAILIVDDNEDNCYTLQRRLSREGYANISIVHDGVEVIEILKKQKFDLMLLDIMMPRMNGFEVLEHLKDEIMARRMIVLAISADDKLDNIIKCIQMGAEDFLPKPFNKDILRARIRSCVERKWSSDQQAKMNEELAHAKQNYQRLLYSIFPPSVVDELSQNNQVAPRNYQNVAVLFADIVDFTKYSNIHTPEDVHENLQQMIEQFETAALRHNVQKIKTIGDAFLATAGMLQESSDPVFDCIQCANAMIESTSFSAVQWQIRVGISYGDVITGIVGHRQYLFDMWGDTVNMAARIQALAEPNTVYLSQEAWEQVQDQCKGESQGEVDVKGKGKAVVYKYISSK